VSLLNAESDVGLFERLGVPRKFWLLTVEQERALRTKAAAKTALRPTPLSSPIRTFDGSSMEFGFDSLSPTRSRRQSLS
jgi:hypothetical protein